ncbi:STAS/SEC14 domain-containing protein [uncultured Oceanisphaera sp.]|uniref:STAS/SEC14 domain-containing protein n=1 Tax=uncultured Oceanisphaera sp. TaxID=353858 RepID=UPI002639A544|nr:STAS/SEC14 domain-containing protein [uncultured Oceanisphaera sp.]
MLEAHGMSVEMSKQDNHTLWLTIKIYGDIAYDDFREMEQQLEQALEDMDSPRIKALVDMIDFNGWEAKALWEDIQFTRKHGDEFSKLAIVGVDLREKLMAMVVDWFLLSSQVQYFEHLQDARAWLEQDEP